MNTRSNNNTLALYYVVSDILYLTSYSTVELPYGDQGLFMWKKTYERLGGYRNYRLFEDYELVSHYTAVLLSYIVQLDVLHAI